MAELLASAEVDEMSRRITVHELIIKAKDEEIKRLVDIHDRDLKAKDAEIARLFEAKNDEIARLIEQNKAKDDDHNRELKAKNDEIARLIEQNKEQRDLIVTTTDAKIQFLKNVVSDELNKSVQGQRVSGEKWKCDLNYGFEIDVCLSISSRRYFATECQFYFALCSSSFRKNKMEGFLNRLDLAGCPCCVVKLSSYCLEDRGQCRPIELANENE